MTSGPTASLPAGETGVRASRLASAESLSGTASGAIACHRRAKADDQQVLWPSTKACWVRLPRARGSCVACDARGGERELAGDGVAVHR